MRSLAIALIAVVLLTISSTASAQRSSGSNCSTRRLDFVEACLGHVLVRAGSDTASVLVDGTFVGNAPLLISIDPDAPHTIEVRPVTGTSLRRTVQLVRAQLFTMDLGPHRRAALRSITWARFAFLDECDGYNNSSTPYSRPMDARELARFRRAHPARRVR